MADGNIEIKVESDREKEADAEMEREAQRGERGHSNREVEMRN